MVFEFIGHAERNCRKKVESMMPGLRTASVRKLKVLFRKSLFVVFSTAVLANVLQAQNPRGALRGTVQDATGGRIPGAKIVVTSIDWSLRREATSEDRGEFRLDDLLPGAYCITVTASGFAPAEANVSIAVSSVREVTVTLKLAAPSETVKVQAQNSSITTQPIDLVSVVHQGVVSSQDLQTLPLANRSFANIAYLAPGTEPVEPSDPTKARITAVSTGGSSGLNNDLSVDGGDNSDDWIGGFLQNVSPDAIQEFAVRTANEDADTGGTTAGSVVITTKRGTNEWHGSGAFYERAAALNARFPIENPAPNPKQPFVTPELRGDAGRPNRARQALVFLLFRVRAREREHGLQPQQPHAVQRPGTTGVGRPYSRRAVDRCSAERADSLSRLHRFAAVRLGAVDEIAMVPARLRRQLSDAQCAAAAGNAAFDWTDHAQ